MHRRCCFCCCSCLLRTAASLIANASSASSFFDFFLPGLTYVPSFFACLIAFFFSLAASVYLRWCSI